MKKFFGVLAASAVLAFSSSSAFAQSGPAGDWTLAMATPQGTTNVALSLRVAGDKLTGEMNSPMGPVAVAGTAVGNDINATADISIQGMALTFVIGGKVEGDTMAGTVKVGDFGEFPFTGTRAGTAPAAAAAVTHWHGRCSHHRPEREVGHQDRHRRDGRDAGRCGHEAGRREA